MGIVTINLSGSAAFLALTMAVSVPVVLVLLLMALASSRYKKHQFRKDQTMVAEYEAPDKLGPAEIGYLFSFRAESSQLYGTIFDLERRGFLAVERRPEGLAAQALAVSTSTLTPAEQYVYAAFKTPRVVSALDIAAMLPRFALIMIQELEQFGYLSGSVAKHYAKVVLGTAALMAAVFPGSLLLLGHDPGLVLTVIFLGIMLALCVYAPGALLLAWFYTRAAGHAWMGTRKLRALWPQLLGYRSYIQLAELDQLAYSSDDLKASCRDAAFGYAVALGLNTGWQKNSGR